MPLGEPWLKQGRRPKKAVKPRRPGGLNRPFLDVANNRAVPGRNIGKLANVFSRDIGVPATPKHPEGERSNDESNENSPKSEAK
jgi:hypothetical protein